MDASHPNIVKRITKRRALKIKDGHFNFFKIARKIRPSIIKAIIS